MKFKKISNQLLLLIVLSATSVRGEVKQSEEYADFNPGHTNKGSEWIQKIVVKSPALRSDVKGNVKIEFQAPGMTVARALCWQQPTSSDPNPFGHDVVLADLKLDAEGNGSFNFQADQFPNGPITVRIFANDKDKTHKDVRELQLYNTGGVVWNQGIPKTDPPAAKGMKLTFSDDFDKALSISADGQGATYTSHKPGGGDFSGWPFSDFEGSLNPFSQVATFLRIRASKTPDGKSSSGLISSARMDFSGFYAAVPYYMECRLIAQSAPGTWPAFWTLTRGGEGTDELDILEAYGGFGQGNPNYTGYSTTSHFWAQNGSDGKPLKALNKANDMLVIGGKSSWSTTFHTYGLKVTEDDTIYYLDDIETFRHPTGELSKKAAHFFLINYAIGGISGWKIDLEREGNVSDMYVDFVRVFSSKPAPVVDTVAKAKAGVQSQAFGFNFSVEGDTRTELKPSEVTGESSVSQSNWNNLSGTKGSNKNLKDSTGQQISGVAVEWSVPDGDNAWRSKAGADWGFTESNLKLQKGYIELGGKINVTEIPYAKYDVYVYFNAADNGGKGKVSISTTSGGVDPKSTYFYKVGWMGGKFIRSTATDLVSAKDGNVVVFSGNTAKSFGLEWVGNLEEGWTGLTGFQIVNTP